MRLFSLKTKGELCSGMTNYHNGHNGPQQGHNGPQRTTFMWSVEPHKRFVSVVIMIMRQCYCRKFNRS